MNYNDIQVNKYKNCNIFGTFNSVAFPNDKNINQYFIDTTYKSFPKNIDNSKCFLVTFGYNYSKYLFELILVALLSHQDTNIY